MIEQIEFGTRDEYLLAEEATERGMAAVVQDLNDQLTVICGLAHLGGDASYDAERTEGYFAQIESAGKKAAQITRQLLVLDPRQLLQDEISPRETESSFRRRLTSARARARRIRLSKPPL
jgi:hypothetical protein